MRLPSVEREMLTQTMSMKELENIAKSTENPGAAWFYWINLVQVSMNFCSVVMQTLIRLSRHTTSPREKKNCPRGTPPTWNHVVSPHIIFALYRTSSSFVNPHLNWRNRSSQPLLSNVNCWPLLKPRKLIQSHAIYLPVIHPLVMPYYPPS